jgi:hypothetical protein
LGRFKNYKKNNKLEKFRKVYIKQKTCKKLNGRGIETFLCINPPTPKLARSDPHSLFAQSSLVYLLSIPVHLLSILSLLTQLLLTHLWRYSNSIITFFQFLSLQLNKLKLPYPLKTYNRRETPLLKVWEAIQVCKPGVL